MDILYEGGIEMNGQIVLCKGVNDGEELECSIRDADGVSAAFAKCVGGAGRTYPSTEMDCIR